MSGSASASSAEQGNVDGSPDSGPGHWALGTGNWALADNVGDDDNWTETHYRLGLVLLILGILQALYGWGIHLERVRLPVSGAGSILRYAHPVVGVSGTGSCARGRRSITHPLALRWYMYT